MSMAYHGQVTTAEYTIAIDQMSPTGALADQSAALTSAERNILPVLHAVAMLAGRINASQTMARVDLQPFLDDLAKAISNLMQSCTQTLQAIASEPPHLSPGWDVHQHLVLGLEALQACHKLVGRVVAYSKTAKSAKAEKDGYIHTANCLASKIVDAASSLHNSARTIHARLEQEMKSTDLITNVLGDFDNNGMQDARQEQSFEPRTVIGQEIYRLLGSSTDIKSMTEDNIRQNGRLEARRLLHTMGESAKHSMKAILRVKVA